MNNSYNYNYVFNCINYGFYIYSFITLILFIHYSFIVLYILFEKLSGQCFVLLNKLIVILININNLFYTGD